MIRIFAGTTNPEAIQRGRLKHSWLENEVLNKTPEQVVRLRRTYGWPEFLDFPADADLALALADRVESGFSPTRLIDDCAPLEQLAEPERKAVRDAVHTAYLVQFDARIYADELRLAAERMRSALQAILAEWNKPDDVVTDAVVQTRWREVMSAAEALREALDALPKGVVLP